MVNNETVSKTAKLIGYASLAFTVIVVIVTILLVESYSGFAAAISAVLIANILQIVWPYLFVAVIALLIAYNLPTNEETEEKEEVPPEQTKLP
jgi:hypothetical protein